MASSFAAYASQFLTNARGNGNSNTETESGVEPLFYSFTTTEGSDAEDGDGIEGRGIGNGMGIGMGIGMGRGTGRGTGPRRGDEYDFDTDDPHLGSGSRSGSGVSGYGYGWLAHQGYEGGDPREEGNDNQDKESEDSGDLPSGLIASGLRLPTRTNVYDSLSESLLPSRTEPTSFNLPSPRRRRPRKTQDAVWTWIWGVCICVCYLSALLSPSNTRIGSRVLLPTLPLLIPLIFLSAFASYLHIVFLRLWMRPVMFLSALGTPLLLLGSGVWGFLASYSTTSDYSVVSLRLLSLLPLLICIYLLHSLYTLYIAFPRLIAQVNHTHALLSLSTFLLFAYPHPSFPSLLLPLLSPLLLFSFLLLSIPFAIVVSTAPTPWTLFAAAVWVWTWGVTRGVLRVTTAAVVGGWYFGVPWAPPLTSDVDLEAHLGRDLDLDLDLNQSPLPSPSSPPSLLLLSALTRASHSSLGSIVVSALRETALSSLSLVIRVLLLGVPALLFSLVALFSKFLPTPLRFLPTPLRFLRTPLSPLTHRLTRPLTNLIPHTSPFPQIYIALTGVSYRTATLRVSSLRGSVSSLRGSSQLHLTSGGSSSVGGFGGLGESRGLGGSGEPGGSRGLGGLGGSRGLGELRDLRGPLTSFPSLLSPLSPPLSLPLPFALITYYFFVSHTQSPTSLFPDSLSLSLSPPLALAPLSTPQALNTPQALSAPPQAGAPHALQAWQASLLAALTTALVGIFCVGVLRDVGDALWVCWVGDTGRASTGRETESARGETESTRGETESTWGETRRARRGETRRARRGETRRARRGETRRATRGEREMERATETGEGTGAAEMGREEEARTGTGTEEARREERREGLRLGTGIKEHRDLVARVFEYSSFIGEREDPEEREREGEGEEGEEEEEEEVIQIHQIPRDPPIPQRYGYVPPRQGRGVGSRGALIPDTAVEDIEDDEEDAEEEDEEDINPFHHSPNPSSSKQPSPSAPYPSSAPSALPLALTLSSKGPLPRSASSSLSSLSSSGEEGEEGGFFGSGLFG